MYLLDRFDVLISKMIFKKWKNIIHMYFGTKSYLKSNCYHTAKHAINQEEGCEKEISVFKIKSSRLINVGRKMTGFNMYILYMFHTIWNKILLHWQAKNSKENNLITLYSTFESIERIELARLIREEDELDCFRKWWSLTSLLKNYVHFNVKKINQIDQVTIDQNHWVDFGPYILNGLDFQAFN